MAAPPHRPPPPSQLRQNLLALRAEGVGFEIAWDRAWMAIIWPHDTTHRRQWREALRSTRREWRAAYRGTPTRASELLRDFRPELFLVEEPDNASAAAA